MLNFAFKRGARCPVHSPFHRPWAEAPFPIKHELEKLVNGGMHAMTLYDSYSVITIVIYLLFGIHSQAT